MMRCRAALEGLDDVHATAATRARVGGLIGCRGTIGRLRLVRGLHRCHRSDQLTDPRDGLGLGAAGQQTAVPYPVESVRQDMHQEPPDELVRLERHGLVAAGSLDPVVLVAERYAGRVGGDEAAVGDRDPVGVAGTDRPAPAPARRTALIAALSAAAWTTRLNCRVVSGSSGSRPGNSQTEGRAMRYQSRSNSNSRGGR